jgi:hypothetical protein
MEFTLFILPKKVVLNRSVLLVILKAREIFLPLVEHLASTDTLDCLESHGRPKLDSREMVSHLLNEL